MAKRKDIIDLLLDQGLITEEEINKAKEEVKKTGLTIRKSLEKLGFISEEDITKMHAEACGVPYMDLTNYIAASEIIKFVPENLAKKYKTVPLFKIGGNLTVAMVDPQDIVALDQIRKASGMDNIEPVLATEKGVQKFLDSYYGTAGSVSDIIESIDKDKIIIRKDEDLAEVAEEPPIVKLVNILIVRAAKDRASDIHIEPEENTVRVRNRIDGVLHEVYSFPKNLHRAIASRVKILANMDISESRLPQDGRINLRLESKELDMRVSTFPTIHGENVVIRLLDKASVVLGLKELGFSKQDFQEFDKLIKRPNGIILVTGPTGSGKTTTLYSALTTINSMDKNIITIEDPVEYELPLIRQTQVNPKIGVTFANGLRAILRQDPDIIMVGEIRDKETADVAIRASLTGHLVFSTLHTNDAPSALTRLIDMGVEPFLISSSVIGILAQRLVRTICGKCKEEYSLQDSVLKDLGMAKGKFLRGKGCSKCKNTGFLGRIGIFELLVVNDQIMNMVNEKKSADQIRSQAIKMGMRILRDDGIDKIKQGITSPDEVLRVTKAEQYG